MGVALITPFKEDDSVDYDALLRLVDYQLQNGTDFLCVLGTTAETPTLTKEEKDKIKRLIIERVNGRIPILLGVSSNCTRAVVIFFPVSTSVSSRLGVIRLISGKSSSLINCIASFAINFRPLVETMTGS